MRSPATAAATRLPHLNERKDKPSPQGAKFAVAVLTAMNLLNYADRYVPSAIKELYKRDLSLSDLQTSIPLTAFVLVYVIASPIFGALADRVSRTKLIAVGVAAWSLATGAAAMATGFVSFFLARAAVGIGEAAYATLSPSLLSDFYPPAKRNRVLTFFYLAIPLGAAVGYSVGAGVGKHLGWRAAFLVAGVPGLLVAALALKIQEPPRGYFDKEKREAPGGWPKALRALGQNTNFLTATAGYTAVMFAGGAIADWFPTFLQRERGFELATAGTLFGAITIVCGIAGTLAGSYAADKLIGRTSHPYLAFSGLAMIPATACAALTLLVPGKAAACIFLALGQLFAWSYNGPINAMIVNSVQKPAAHARDQHLGPRHPPARRRGQPVDRRLALRSRRRLAARDVGRADRDGARHRGVARQLEAAPRDGSRLTQQLALELPVELREAPPAGAEADQ